MNNLIIKNLIRLVGLVLLQLLILKDVDLSWGSFDFIHLFVYPLVIMLFPLRTPRVVIILAGFFLGLFIDVFYDSLGVHASATLLMAYSRKIVLRFLEPSGGYSVDQVPTLRNMGISWFFIYCGALLFIHLLFYFSMESFSIVFFFRILMNTIFSFIFSLLLILIVQFIFNSKS